MKRRGKKEGNIRQRPDGRWEARIDLGWKNGKRVRKSFYGATYDDVRKKLTEATGQHDKGMTIPTGRETVEQFLNSWLDTVKIAVRIRTWEFYDRNIRLAIPHIGHIPLASLKSSHIRSMLIVKQNERKLNGQSLRHLCTVLSTAFNTAVDDGKQDEAKLARNPMASVKRPTKEPFEHKPLAQEQVNAFMKALAESRHGGHLAVTLACGLRPGEALGLRWQDVNFEARTIHIVQSIQRVRAKVAGKAGYLTAPPKSEKSRRTLPLAEAALPLLTAWRVQQKKDRLAAGSAWEDRGLVFTNRHGSPVDPTTVREAFHDVLEAAGIERRRVYDLRHSAATFGLEKGIDLRVIMEFLGHSTITLTANTYAHVRKRLLDQMAAKMDEVLKAEPTQAPQAGKA